LHSLLRADTPTLPAEAAPPIIFKLKNLLERTHRTNWTKLITLENGIDVWPGQSRSCAALASRCRSRACGMVEIPIVMIFASWRPQHRETLSSIGGRRTRPSTRETKCNEYSAQPRYALSYHAIKLFTISPATVILDYRFWIFTVCDAPVGKHLSSLQAFTMQCAPLSDACIVAARCRTSLKKKNGNPKRPW